VRPLVLPRLRPVAGAYEFGGGGERAAIRAEMGDDVYEAAQAEGRAMTLEQAIEYALAPGTS
jgi:hypothetical protein